jgi:glucose-1-phosphate adenylyltransferase
MSDTLIGSNSELYSTIIGENSVIGSNVKSGTGEFAESAYNPKVYDSKITVIGSNTVIPNNTVLGKNVVVDNFVTPHDFLENHIPSGGYLIKGGDKE